MILQVFRAIISYAVVKCYYTNPQLPIFLPLVGTHITYDYPIEETGFRDPWSWGLLPLLGSLANMGILIVIFQNDLFVSSIPMTLACLRTLVQMLPFEPFDGRYILFSTKELVCWQEKNTIKALILQSIHVCVLLMCVTLLLLV
jgi:hypothetical protein